MGFYYGKDEPPEEPQGTWREVAIITLEVFRTLSIPFAMIFGVIAYLILTFFLFVSVHALAGLGAIGLVVLAIGLFALWEWRHPPKPEDVRLGRG